MGKLKSLTTDDILSLSIEHTIGRSRTCALCIPSPQISGEHAVIRWTLGRWELRDLGSSNGTFLNGVRLEAGKPTPLHEGARVAFGNMRNAFQFADAGPPPAVARTCSREERSDEDGLLVLPDPENPLVVIALDSDGHWTASYEGGPSHRVHDQDVVECGGHVWRLSLPVGIAPTQPADGRTRMLANVGLRFTVSRDEEDVEVELIVGGEYERLKPRAHGYLLLTLARLRIDDQARTALSEAEHGWVNVHELEDMLRQPLPKLRLDMHRARKQLDEAGVLDAAELFERQTVSKKVRIGISRLEVRRVDEVDDRSA